MRADQQVCVAAGDDTFQIACEDPSVIDELRLTLRDLVVDRAALPGFKINPPSSQNKLWVLLGPNGGVLARSRDAAAVMRSLLRHIAALQDPTPRGLECLLFHTVVGPDAAVLVEPRLLTAHPLVEKQANRRGLRLVDSSFTVLDVARGRVCPTSTQSLGPLPEDVGHVDPSSVDLPVVGVLWPSASADDIEPTAGQLAHAYASAARTGTNEARIELGIRLAETISITLVPTGAKNGLLPAVETELRRQR